MDRKLNRSTDVHAKNLLSTSPQFEPFIPETHQNTLNALQMLGSLAGITANHLGELQDELEGELEKSLKKLPEPPLEKPAEHPRAAAQTSIPKNEKYAALLEALEAIRDSSHPYHHRKSAHQSPIIRAKTEKS